MLSKKELLAQFKKELEFVPYGFEVCILRYFERLTKAEIAKALEVSVEEVNAALMAVANIVEKVNNYEH